MNQFEAIFEEKWDEIKSKLKRRWSKLTKNDIQQIDGSLEELKEFLKKTYNYETDQIEEELSNFFDLIGIKSCTLSQNAIEKAQEMKQYVKECIHEYLQNASKTTEKIWDYSKENPFKSSAMIFLAGVGLATLVLKNKN